MAVVLFSRINLNDEAVDLMLGLSGTTSSDPIEDVRGRLDVEGPEVAIDQEALSKADTTTDLRRRKVPLIG